MRGGGGCRLLRQADTAAQNNTFTITADYSAYGARADQLMLRGVPTAYADASLQAELPIVSGGHIVSGSTITYTFEDDGNAAEVYIVPPIISRTRETQAQSIPIQNGENESDLVERVTLQAAKDPSGAARPIWEIVVELSPALEEWPENMTLASGGRHYIGTKSEAFEGWSSLIPERCAYTYPITGDEAEAREVLEGARLSYSVLAHYEFASDAVFHSDRVVTVMEGQCQ